MTPKTLDAPMDASISTENGSTAPTPFSTLDDFFASVPRPREEKVIGGRLCYFEGLSAINKDNLITAHSREDEAGKVSIDQKRWRTDVIAGAWVKSFGGERWLAKPEDAERFYRTIPSQIELEMYDVAQRVCGIGDDKNAETRKKNSEGTGGTSTSPSSA